MKKGLKVLTIMLATFMSVTCVKADTIIDITYGGSDPKSELWYLNNLNWTKWTNSINGENGECNSNEDCYQKAIDYFSTLNYQYYSMFVSISPTNNNIELKIIPFNLTTEDNIIQWVYTSDTYRYLFYKNSREGEMIANVLSQYHDPNRNNFYHFYDSNYNFVNDGDYVFKGFYDNEGEQNYNNMLQVHSGDTIPKIKDLIQYDSWSDYENEHLEGYTEINLDNYEYVLLSLKNYNQTQAFQTNLQVKGQIGITPIYNFGQTSKDNITGSQVQDRCNIAYENYTAYPFYILQSDLQNNTIYAVKECSSGSSFKFDNTVFNITYVTEENKNNPTVTIGGKTYNVIPYGDLPSTATKNEEDNYIPGESENEITGNTVGINAIIKNAQQKIGEIWETLTYFTSFIGLIFSIFPSEIHVVLISAFIIMIMLGVLKIFLGK